MFHSSSHQQKHRLQQEQAKTKDTPSQSNFPTAKAKRSDSQQMEALQWFGKKDVRIEKTGRVMITDPTDVIIQVTTASIGGTDLHLYLNMMQKKSIHSRDIIGHEAVGKIVEVGPEVKKFSVGDRVVVSSVISCGQCQFCSKENYQLCDFTNSFEDAIKNYGHRSAGSFGLGKIHGGYDGLLAEYARIPLADHNLLKIGEEIPDATAILLSDVACTAWHGIVMGNVDKDSVVLIMGAGPVGCSTAAFACYKGASAVILVDDVQHRLDLAKQNLSDIHTFNIDNDDFVESIKRIAPHGPDVTIDCVGWSQPKDLSHKLKKALRIEKDNITVLDNMITLTRKGGRLVILGDYIGLVDKINFGGIFNKSLTLKTGITPVQKYWRDLYPLLERNMVNLQWITTRTYPFEQAAKAFQVFDSSKDEILKPLITMNPQQSTTLNQ